MLRGLRILLDACRRAGVERFIHLSSVLVHGDPPSPAAKREDGPTRPAPGSYGHVKLEQDRLVAGACKAGLPSIILCAPNISGPYSQYLLGILTALRARQLALVDDGSAPCSLVDVGNLVHAIMLALEAGTPDGRRLFITDAECTTWRELFNALRPLTDGDIPPSIPREELIRRMRSSSRPSISLLRSLKRLVSSEVRSVLRQDPLWERVDIATRSLVRWFGSAAEDRLRLGIEGPPIRPSQEQPSHLDLRLMSQQLRGVWHSSELAYRWIGYAPRYSFTQSMSAFRRWCTVLHGGDLAAADLLALVP
jgi:hypothetical protein